MLPEAVLDASCVASRVVRNGFAGQSATKWKDERASVVRPRGLPEAAAVQKIEALLCSHQDFAKNTFALVEIQIAIRDMNVVPIFRFLQRPLMKSGKVV